MDELKQNAVLHFIETLRFQFLVSHCNGSILKNYKRKTLKYKGERNLKVKYNVESELLTWYTYIYISFKPQPLQNLNPLQCHYSVVQREKDTVGERNECHTSDTFSLQLYISLSALQCSGTTEDSIQLLLLRLTHRSNVKLLHLILTTPFSIKLKYSTNCKSIIRPYSCLACYMFFVANSFNCTSIIPNFITWQCNFWDILIVCICGVLEGCLNVSRDLQ